VSYGLAHANVLFSSNSRCVMEIQCLEENQDQATAIGEDTDGSIACFNTKTDSRIAYSDWEDASSLDLATSSETEDGPEVFKRVRFLSRWEYRHESRGKLCYRIDQYSWWGAACPEALAMKHVSAGTLERRIWSNPVPARYDEWKADIFIGLFFVGKTLQQSIPVLAIFSMDKKKRKKAWNLLAGLDWVKAHPSLVLLTTCHNTFHPDIKLFYQSRREVTAYHQSISCKTSPTKTALLPSASIDLPDPPIEAGLVLEQARAPKGFQNSGQTHVHTDSAGSCSDEKM
jgi:hypothetical protein